MWEIEGISMEDGWRVGGREGGEEGLLGNRLVKEKLEPWLQLVETFACYPGPRLIWSRQEKMVSFPCGR